MNATPSRWSVVIPCLNEEENILEVVNRLRQLFEARREEKWNLIFVDDGSTDRSVELLEEAHSADSRVCGLILSRNFGHQQALTTGLAYANADYIGVIDCDLQDPVEELGKMFGRMETEKLDVCYGVRRTRVASPLLRMSYRIFYRVLNLLAERPWPLDSGDFSVMSRRAVTAICAMPERERVLRGMRTWIGMRQAPHPYDRPARLAGETKYSWRKLASLARRSIIAFSVAPLRFASWLAVVFAGIALAIFALLMLNRVFPQATVFGYQISSQAGTMTIVSMVSLSSAAALLCLGIIGEYLALIYEELKGRPVTVVTQRIGTLSPAKSDIHSTPLTTDLSVHDI